MYSVIFSISILLNLTNSNKTELSVNSSEISFDVIFFSIRSPVTFEHSLLISNSIFSFFIRYMAPTNKTSKMYQLLILKIVKRGLFNEGVILILHKTPQNSLVHSTWMILINAWHGKYVRHKDMGDAMSTSLKKNT